VGGEKFQGHSYFADTLRLASSVERAKKKGVRGFVFEKLIFQFSTFSFFARCSLHNEANLFAVGRFVQAKIADFSKFFSGALGVTVFEI
jgi:hypothetical protein